MLPSSEANPWKQHVTIPQDSVVIQVDIVNTRPMEEKMVHLSAAEMQDRVQRAPNLSIVRTDTPPEQG